MNKSLTLLLVTALVVMLASPVLSRSELELSHAGGKLWTQARHVAVNGSYAYCPVPYGLYVLDISDPTAPEEVLEIYLPGAFDVTISGHYAYVACGHPEAKDSSMTGLAIFDITDPAQPVQVGAYSNRFKVCAVAVSGNYAFLANYFWGGLVILDISDPSSPSLVWQSDTPGSATDVAVVGHYVYVCDVFSLLVFDITDVYNPVLVGSYPLEQSFRLAVDGEFAYMADRTTGLEIIDISDPTDPKLAGRYTALGTAFINDVEVENGTAYLSLETVDSLPWYYAFDVVDVSSPSTPTLIGRHEMGTGSKPGVAIAGDYAFLADSDHLRAIDISDPAAPTQAGDYRMSGMLWKVDVSGDYAYAATRGALVILDISGPDPQVVGSYPALSGWDVAVRDNLAIVADYKAGVVILDITDPSLPVELAKFDTPDKATSVTIDGNLLYVADNTSALIYDISNPSLPELIAEIPTPGSATHVVTFGNYAYVADYDGGINIVDVSNLSQPVIMGHHAAEPTRRMQIVGSYLYAIASGGIEILDLSDPAVPILISFCDIFRTQEDIAVSGDYAFLASSYGGVNVVNISDPYHPYEVANRKTPGYCYGVAVDGNRAFTADWYGFEVMSYVIIADCGDANGDKSVNVGDAVYLVNHIFHEGAAPSPCESGDANCDGSINVGDAVYLTNYIFHKDSPEPCANCP